jgi:hypothetical protein
VDQRRVEWCTAVSAVSVTILHLNGRSIIVRKPSASLIVPIAIAFAASSQTVLAGGVKSSANLHNYTATGKHIDDAKITARTKPKEPKGNVNPGGSQTGSWNNGTVRDHRKPVVKLHFP